MQTLLTITSFLIFLIFPGYLLLRLFISKEELSKTDKIIYSTVLGFFINLLIFTMLDKSRIKIEKSTLIASLGTLALVSFFIKKPSLKIAGILKQSFTKNYFILAISLLLIVLIRVPVYLSHPLPYTTDLSHHIYYAKHIIENGSLPKYSKSEFVLLEHITLSLSPLLVGTDVLGISSFVILYILNFFSGITIFRLTFHATKSFSTSLISLLLSSCFFLYTSFNLRFVLGGVVGNLLGNFFIPSFILLLILFFEKKYYHLLPIIIINLICIITAHTLSTVIIFWVTTIALLFYFIINRANFLCIVKELFRKYTKYLLFSIICTFIFLLYVPDYFSDKRAMERISIPQMSILTPKGSFFSTLTENNYLREIPKKIYIISFLGLASYFFSRPKTKFSKFIFVTWPLIPLGYTVFPNAFPIRIPPHRAINYAFSPLMLSTALFCSFFSNKSKKLIVFFLLILSIIVNMNTSVLEIKSIANNKKVMEENKEAFVFLSKIIKPNENVFTDHTSDNLADQAIKNYIDNSNKVWDRAFLFRYEEGMPWDTWNMMEDPKNYLNLYREKNIKYVVVPNQKTYTERFEKTNAVNKIFENETVQIFELK